ncbi:PREDICTED: transient receptor potential cation channel subfamily V member 5-like [Nanorana parkeri]|uniref:transient receptor potential cation channel subfamily V member 5-like n=1 Tax=Nanorana parkeri TaxID=125878 RepID=UPI000854D75A|nr:PREDICTED: transient receptor potential cation channel subfamily V member 5-like [Nanorana parkeri]
MGLVTMDKDHHCSWDKRILFEAVASNDCLTMRTLLQGNDIDPAVRGSLGETILHTAILNGQMEVLKVILDCVPSLINEPMLLNYCKGKITLHMAMLKQDLEIVELMLKNGVGVRSQASCSCEFECAFYYGDYPLSFAACTGNEEILKLLLVDYGASLNAQDSQGNTVFHILVMQQNKEMACHMYNLILDLVPLTDSQCAERLENNDGFTPLKLAANEGNIEMFSYLVKRQKKIYWTIGTISYSIYDLTNIDTWMAQNSVLDIITSSQKPQVRKLVDITPVKELLGQKWKSFGYRSFLVWMFSYLAYMVVFTAVSLHRPLKPLDLGESNDITVMTPKKISESYESTEDLVRLTGELITLFGAIIILFVETPLLFKLGPKKYIGNASTGGPFSLLMVGYSLLIFSAAVLRVLGHEAEAIPLSLALIIGWCNSIYFARGFKMLGQFSIMIQKIIFADFLCWFCLVFIIIIGFSSAFYVMYQTMDPEVNPFVDDFPKALYDAIEMMMGLTNLKIPTDTSFPLIYVAYSVYMVFVYLLLLNMLIAMMDNTYWRVAKEREELWKIQVAATILLLERHMPKFLKVRTGIPGSSLGLDDKKWYIGVEEILDEYMAEKIKPPVGLGKKSTLCWNKIRRNISLIISMNDNSEITVL